MEDVVYKVVCGQGKRVEFEVSLAGKTHNIYFQSADAELELNAEAIAACLLYPCMAKSARLVLRQDTDQVFNASLATIQNIASDWFPGLHPIPIEAGLVPTVQAERRGSASFFSGGLDSFYTLNKHIDTLDSIIFVHGFDVELDDAPARRLCSDLVRTVAAHYGKQAIEIETNLRSLIDDSLHWGHSHGAAFAVVGHLLRASVERIYIASSYTYRQLFPWGSHPLLDPEWSSASLSIIHDGCEASRIEKAQLAARSPFVMQNLRVCWKNPGDKKNCGVCEKCVRTMINLEVAGCRNYQEFFPKKLSPGLVKAIPFFKDSSTIFAQENLAALSASGIRPDLKKAVETVMNRSRLAIEWRFYWNRRKRKASRALGKFSVWLNRLTEISTTR